MDAYWPVVLLAGMLLVIWLMSRRKRAASRRESRVERRVEGFQVVTPLHPRMGRGCLFDFGLQYGPGFRRKEAPALPHDENCLCEALPFVFTSSEVFGGALRRFSPPRCDIPGFPAEAVPHLLAALRRSNAQPIPATLQEYLEQSGLAEVPEPLRQPVESFLGERFAYLTELARLRQGGEPLTDSPRPAAEAVEP
ncbi:MAG TPA: hypothetical protein VL359_20130 [bacterium]|nr:hypothetical protein [bacterium]